MAAASLIATAPAQACGDQNSVYIGSVCMTAATFCPNGYVDANGQLLAISQYQALVSLIGMNYGGNGTSTFGMPDLRGHTAVGLGQSPGLSPVMQGQKRGAEQTTLSVANLPAHTHTLNAVSTGATVNVTTGAWLANSQTEVRSGTPAPVNTYTPSGTPVELNKGSIGSAGGNQPVNNLPLQLGMRYCIAVQGIYPPRNSTIGMTGEGNFYWHLSVSDAISI